MKTILTIFPLCFLIHSSFGFMMPDDSQTAKYWKSLSQKEKAAFLFGYRVATGGVPQKVMGRYGKMGWEELPQITITAPSSGQFPEVIKLIDSFYEDDGNWSVRTKGALEIVTMKLQTKDTESIQQKIEFERSLIGTSF